MKKMQWILISLLLVFLAGFAFAAGEKETDKTQADRPLGKVWSEGNLTLDNMDKDVWIKADIAANTYTHAMPNDAEYLLIMEEKYKIDFNVWPCYGDEWRQQVNLRLAAGERFDIFNPKQFTLFDLLDQDLIRDVPLGMMKEFMPLSWEDWHDNIDNPFMKTKVDGVNWAIPGFYVPGKYPYVVIIRDDWMKAAGVDGLDPGKLEDLEKILYAFAKDDPDGNGKNDTYGLSNRGMIAVFGAFGGYPYSPSGEGSTPLFVSLDGESIYHPGTLPQMKDCLALFRKWYADGVLDPEFVTGEHTGGHWAESQGFFRGRIGYTHGAMFYYHGTAVERGSQDPHPARYTRGFLETQASLGNDNAHYTYVAPPTGPKGHQGTECWGANTGPWWVFGKHLENDEYKMARLMNWQEHLGQYLDDGFAVFAGTKGEDWIYDEDKGQIVQFLSEKTREADLQGTSVLLGLTHAFDALSFKHEMNKDRPSFEWAEKIVKSPSRYTDLADNVEVLKDYDTDLMTLTTTYFTDIITGKRPLDAFDEYVDKWMEMGGKEVLDAANKWYATVK